MSILDCIYQMIIGPLKIMMEFIYGTAYIILGHAGMAIIPLSLTVNFLLLPFYKRADAIQQKERETEKKLALGLAHIKNTFRGDERYMMQQAFYRINHYKPVYALKSALPLLLQIPFFIAAYQFLSHLALFEGVSFLFVKDLSKPDSLLTIGGLTINILPILMTLINLLSSRIYTQGLGMKDKLQLYGMALVFLMLLYNSPSGLVIYWTLNNLFSLIKNLIQTAKRPSSSRIFALSVLGALFLLYGAVCPEMLFFNRIIIILISFLFHIPSCLYLIRKMHSHGEETAYFQQATNSHIFQWSCLFLTILVGILIPSAVIRSSPAEFVIVTDFHSPVLYILYSFLTAAGAFLLWGNLFYSLSGQKNRLISEAIFFIISINALMNYMLFGTKLGMLSPQLQFEETLSFSNKELLIHSEVAIFLSAALLVLWSKRKRAVAFILPVLATAVLGMSIYNITQINAEMPSIQRAVESGEAGHKYIELSRHGKNVIIVMLDRSINGFIPYLFQEKPELEKKFDGFTWYPNTLSYGPATNTGSPALFGGYEYTPEEMNKRKDMLLEEKHNEALLVMPLLFSDAGYQVTVCDPTYAGYSWIPDLSIYDRYPGINAFIAESKGIGDQYVIPDERLHALWKRNFFCYSMMKIAPLILQPGIYQDGHYFDPASYGSNSSIVQSQDGLSKSTGLSESFFKSYNVLCALPKLTQITDAENAFFIISNSTTHDRTLLKEPEYTPATPIDNTEYDSTHANRFVYQGKEMKIHKPVQMMSYQINMAALLRLGEFFDYLRSEGIYDQTRIIIVADHGEALGCFDDMMLQTDGAPRDMMSYNPLLLVKDFDCHGFTTDYRFMTNADTPSLSMKDIIASPVNPFTGELINEDAKGAEEQHVFDTKMWKTDVNNGNTFLPGTWYSLKNQNIFDMNNWEKIGEY